MLQAANSGRLPQLEDALENLKTTRTVLQWIPSHCGIQGNEEADRMAKLGAEGMQEENPVSMAEMKNIIKSLYQPPQTGDSYHQLSGADQVVIFRLRTGHNRLRWHLRQKLHLIPSPTCTCGEAEQTSEHVLQDCQDLQSLRQVVWPVPVPVHDKLYGPVEALRRTANFISRAGLQV